MGFTYKVTTPDGAVVYTNINPNIPGNAPAGSTVQQGSFTSQDVVSTNVTQSPQATGISAGYTSTQGASSMYVPPQATTSTAINTPTNVGQGDIPISDPSPTPAARSAASTSQTLSAASTTTSTTQPTIPILDTINSYLTHRFHISNATLTKLEEIGLGVTAGAIGTVGVSSLLKHRARRGRRSHRLRSRSRRHKKRGH